MSLEKKIIAILKESLGDGSFPLHEPRFNGNESLYVEACIATTYVSSVGSYVNQFEKELAGYVGVKNATATVNGTAALMVALKLAGVKLGDEVLIPTLTFVATANAVHQLSAHVHFVDSCEETFGIDPLSLRDWLKHIAEPSLGGYRNRITGRKISALVPVHIFGHPCDMDGLLAVAADFKLVMVEDASESLGSFYHGRHTGSFGLLSAVSFNGNKIITTGGGGAILTNDNHLAEHAKHLTTTAKIPHRWEYVHDEIGYNFRMPNINAALGCAQLERLPSFLASKHRLTNRYKKAFSNLEHVKLKQNSPGCNANYWLQTLVLDRLVETQLGDILKQTNDAGFMTRPAWKPLHLLRPYKDCQRASLTVAESLSKRIINLPSSSGLA
jgi:perosamine synthetase